MVSTRSSSRTPSASAAKPTAKPAATAAKRAPKAPAASKVDVTSVPSVESKVEVKVDTKPKVEVKADTKAKAKAETKAKVEVKPKAETKTQASQKRTKEAGEESKAKSVRTDASSKLLVQIERAVEGLVAFEADKKKDSRSVLSLDDEDATLPPAEEQAARTVWLNVGLVRMHEDDSLKPSRLPVPHPWRSAEAGEAAGLRVCLVVKDPQREYKDAVTPLRLSAIAKVAGVGKLRKKFPSFEQRRQLVAAHDMFLADKRVFAMLPAILGKEVYSRRKHPVPVDVSASVLASPEALKRELTAAIEATYLIPSSGTTSLSIRVGVIGQSAAHIAANVDAVVRQLATKLDGGLANVRSLHVKTPTSAALPIYARTAPSS